MKENIFMDTVFILAVIDTSDKLIIEGICSIHRLKHQVTNILWNIFKNIGEKKYLELWVEHKFPTKLYKELNNAN